MILINFKMLSDFVSDLGLEELWLFTLGVESKSESRQAPLQLLHIMQKNYLSVDWKSNNFEIIFRYSA